MHPTALVLAFGLLAFASFPLTAEEPLFKDDFKDALSKNWQLVGLKKTHYRLRDGGLEMRVQPGKLGRDTPMLKVVLPFTAADTVIASVKVTPLDDFTAEGEFAGLCLVDESGPEFAAKKQRIGERLVFSPGKHEFVGAPGEEGDPARYIVGYHAAAKEAGPLRVISRGGYAHFQVGPSADGKYLNFFHSAVREKSKERGFCLVAAGAPDGKEHWVRFEEFSVVRP